jgi:hypothetical protein
VQPDGTRCDVRGIVQQAGFELRVAPEQTGFQRHDVALLYTVRHVAALPEWRRGYGRACACLAPVA